MMRRSIHPIAIAILCVSVLLPGYNYAADAKKTNLEKLVGHAIRPVMERYGVPGMAVGIVVKGQAYVYSYGSASTATGRAVTSNTLFEIGSISKTFTATLATYAQVSGKLDLTDMASKYLPSLRGSAFDRVSLLNLGTHTSGGLPLQVPDDITNDDQLTAYLQNWKPTYPPGSYRTYSNPSIGLLGMVAAKSMNGDFVSLMEGKLFPELGLTHTYLEVPKAETENYAQGYTAAGVPVRMKPGVLASEAYGIRTTIGDMLRFVEANMGMLDLDERLQRAITNTHTGYYRVGAMTQDVIWEQLRYPAKLPEMLAANSDKLIFAANPVVALAPSSQSTHNVLINKTGSTNGFAAYVAFAPERKIGVVILANKSYPIGARVTAAYEILTRLDDDSSKD